MCFAAGSGRPQAATFIPPSILLSTGASKRSSIGWQKSTEKFSSKSTIDHGLRMKFF